MDGGHEHARGAGTIAQLVVGERGVTGGYHRGRSTSPNRRRRACVCQGKLRGRRQPGDVSFSLSSSPRQSLVSFRRRLPRAGRSAGKISQGRESAGGASDQSTRELRGYSIL